ncbi:sensor histidine kinase [Flaviaesturariibacter amylovorans]|uniref:histidine kinase n=1 Tax=Flaviaesturariibacter amylovorans TaxID=1084520 RepID=A0ABP8HHI2_9BACT
MADRFDEVVIMIILASLLLLLLAVIVIVSVIKYKQRQRRHVEEKNAIRQQFNQELLHTRIEIQEQTLKHIAQEIHDNIGQTLSLAKLHLNTIGTREGHEGAEKLGTTKDLVSKAIVDLRGLSRTLNSDAVLSGGLLKAVESELALIGRAGVFTTSLEITGQPVSLDPQKELILFRIVQEALNNSIKHSEASRIVVSLSYGENSVCTSVADNGKGAVRAPAADQPGGTGLLNMKSRSEIIGGTFSFTSAASGTEVRVILPTN